ncbi:hypothetical protein [Mycobacterium nebraskense]|uniref:Uncharacterized protein n=1 Tax=Mycobacterium nebraskense TaxID=244292 RepID=A0A1X1ZN19_9MYCO|nr:hypothetical protein [Mycobacterium nebraskense]KKC05642.1 hypothetical protein WU83_07260 [Mycobacterium nebraskense]MBI2693587.1 hypothetical protein [Mycobacterium nebraskense]ORW24766.1 hypothetical protein AWC17_03025 [Mycobacterium nebraskense]
MSRRPDSSLGNQLEPPTGHSLTALWTLRSKSHDLHLDDLVVLPHFYGTEMILCAGDYRGIW